MSRTGDDPLKVGEWGRVTGTGEEEGDADSNQPDEEWSDTKCTAKEDDREQDPPLADPRVDERGGATADCTGCRRGEKRGTDPDPPVVEATGPRVEEGVGGEVDRRRELLAAGPILKGAATVGVGDDETGTTRLADLGR